MNKGRLIKTFTSLWPGRPCFKKCKFVVSEKEERRKEMISGMNEMLSL